MERKDQPTLAGVFQVGQSRVGPMTWKWLIIIRSAITIHARRTTNEDWRPPIHPGEHLAEILSENGLTAHKLAKAIGVSPVQVSGIIGGERQSLPKLLCASAMRSA